MTRKETEHGRRQERLGHLKNRHRRLVSENGAAEKIGSLINKVDSVSLTEAGLLLPLDRDNIQKTSPRPPQMRRRKTQLHDRSAGDLTCDEADVDLLLSAGELT
jgi:hypothetical protein